MSFKSESRPKEIKAGENLGRILSDPNTFNAPARELGTLKQHLARNFGGDPFDWAAVDHFTGKVFNSAVSAAYPYDPRYEIKRQRPKWSLADHELLTFEDDIREEEWNRTVIATNLSESATSHTLAVDTIVHVFGVVIDKDSPVIHYFFVSGGIAGFFPVKVEKTAGSNGTKTTAASWTYTVRTIAWNGSSGGSVLGTGVALTRPRPAGTATVQAGSTGYGMAFYDGSTLKLWDAGEIYGSSAC